MLPEASPARTHQPRLDHTLEGVEGLGRGQHQAIDEERWRAVYPRLHSGVEFLLDAPRHLAAVQTCVEGQAIEAELPRMRLEVPDRQPVLMGEELIVQLPEPPLLLGTARSLGRLLRLVVDGERELPGTPAAPLTRVAFARRETNSLRWVRSVSGRTPHAGGDGLEREEYVQRQAVGSPRGARVVVEEDVAMRCE